MTKPIPVEMYCPIHQTKLTVYCYNIYDDVVLSNGCEHMHNSDCCIKCCKDSVPLAKEKLSAALRKFPFEQN
jgi:hypothetical protein